MNLRRLILIYFLICWLAVILLGLLSPMPIVIAPIDKITLYDKAVHIVLFAVFAFLLISLFDTFDKIRFKRACLFGAILSGAFIVISEYLQAYVPGRSPSTLDFLAGVIGVLLGALVAWARLHEPKPKILLHTCCATCAVYVQEVLSKNYEVVIYYFNPNTYPKNEYQKRLKDIKKIALNKGLKLIIGKYEHNKWKKAIKGHEKDKEGGKRCLICYGHRLEATARKASGLRIQYFTSTLTVSPHKKAETINRIGKKMGDKYGAEFLDKDFKKNDGFKKSMELSKKYKFYRQDYCGCEYSVR